VGLPQFAEQLAVRVTLFPLQIVVEAGEMETVGCGFTVIDLLTIVVHPFAFVTE